MVEKGVVKDGTRFRRWKGESMLNSSWMVSDAGGVYGTYLSQMYSESSML